MKRDKAELASIVEQVDGLQARCSYLTHEQACARLGIAWQDYTAARRALGLPKSKANVAAKEKHIAEAVMEKRGRRKTYSDDDLREIVRKVDEMAAEKDVTLGRAARLIGITPTLYSYAKWALKQRGQG